MVSMGLSEDDRGLLFDSEYVYSGFHGFSGSADDQLRIKMVFIQ